MSLAFDELFSAIDHSDTDQFLDFVTEDAEFKFANMPSVKGKSNIRGFLDGFFGSIDHTEHMNLEKWPSEDGNKWTVQGEVAYVRKDGNRLQVPFCNVFKLDKDKQAIKEYLIYVDNSELYS